MALIRSGLRGILNLESLIGHMRRYLLDMAHNEIKEAKTLGDLGYSMETRISRTVRVGWWGKKKISLWNDENHLLSMDIYHFDEGVFCHLINKVSKMIRDGVVAPDDYLCIYDDEMGCLCRTLNECEHDMLSIESDQMYWALTEYVSAINVE